MKTLVSVIVPVYNAQKFLDRCIETIRDQTLREIEIIFINDGSTDDSLDILRKYEKLDSRIKIINQKNSGPSAARNKGIKAARGEYISFIDADDWIEKDMYKKMYDEAFNNQAELVISDYWECKEKRYYHKVMDNNLYEYDKEAINKIIIKELLSNSKINSLWNKLFKKNVILENNIILDENIFYAEDWLFIFCFCLHIKKAVYINEAFYNYIRGHKSLSNSYGKDTFDITGLWIYNKRKEFAKKLNYDEYSGAMELFNVLIHCIIEESNRKNVSINNRIANLKALLMKVEVKEMTSIMKQKKLDIKQVILLYLIDNKLYFTLFIYSKIAKIKSKLNA